MTLRERVRAADRLQKSRGFKIGASIGVALLVVSAAVLYVVLATSEGAGGLTLPEGLDPEVAARAQAQYSLFEDIAGASNPLVGMGVTALLALVAVIGVIWLGLGLTYLGLGLIGALVAGPLLLADSTAGAGRMIGGVVALTMAFTALMQGARLLLAGSKPVLSIARNVLAEAVRLKLSMVFVVMLIVLMAALPLLLDDAQPLRYRVQTFLQWATGGSFWIIATMVVFFSVGTVAFEQRDKIIWQTMTKPVAPWQYLLGKWLGVSLLAAILLAVSSSGVFLFTEYLRTQPAEGEVAGEIDPLNLSEDRVVLETQVLTARKSVYPQDLVDIRDEAVDVAVREQIERERRQDPDYDPSPAELRALRIEVVNRESLEYRSIDPAGDRYEEFVFLGLEGAKGFNRPITLRYKVNAEGNRPDALYTLMMETPDGPLTPPPGRTTGLGFSHTLTFSPEFIGEDGRFDLRIWNGALRVLEDGRPVFVPNPATITFPVDGLELSYAAGSYHMNFVRIVFVLWIKLAFLAALGIWAGTFLSFPVAGLVSVGTFLVAEGASFVQSSIDMFSLTDYDGNTEAWRVVAKAIADTISNLFLVYSELRPTTRLSDGRLLSWYEVGGGTVVLAIAMSGLLLTGVYIMKRRELAIYSGH
ncbi:MAG: ABC transporter permease [Phycisphaerales bacterium JB040]